MLTQTNEATFRAYVACALWSSTDSSNDSGGEPLDANYSPADLSDQALTQMRADVDDFLQLLEDERIDVSDLDPEQIGHDLWLTRNRHGAGFWDRGLGDLGDRLTALSHPYGEAVLYVGDDGLIYHG